MIVERLRKSWSGSSSLTLAGAGLFLIVAATILSGCQDVLFNSKDPRTQFETHDRLRQRYVPLEEKSVFGESQPALRARLSPNN